MKITITNISITITDVSFGLVKDIDNATAPLKKGYRFNAAFRNGMWDGKEHLIKRGSGCYTAPIGILKEVLKVAEEWGEPVEIEDNRRMPTSSIDTDWNKGWSLRDYQKEAVDSITKIPITDVTAGKGLLRLPTRSGKTVIAAGIIDHLKIKTLFLVQSEMLLAQTIELFDQVLRVPIGKIGGGEWCPENITVASCQTLTRKFNKDKALKLFKETDLVIFDECHHLEGASWRSIVDKCDAPYKIGLSATIYLNNEEETPKGTIWIKAATGDVLYSMEPSDLIRMGYLVRPTIKLLRVEGDQVYDTFQDAYSQGIVNNLHRNNLVANITRQAVQKGLSTLVVANRIEHIEILSKMMSDMDVNHSVIIGSTKSEDRRKIVKDYVDGKVNVLLGTVFGEGVDIPKIECVINAQGGKSKKATMQRFRNLTPSKGKTSAIFVDFLDFTSKWLAEHSKQRLSTYRENEEFIIEILEDAQI